MEQLEINLRSCEEGPLDERELLGLLRQCPFVSSYFLLFCVLQVWSRRLTTLGRQRRDVARTISVNNFAL